MTIEVVLGQAPFMQFTGPDGKWAADGYMVTKDWDTREDKPTYSDPDHANPLSNPIELDGLGRTPPIFFETDAPYFLAVYAHDDTLIWDSPQPYIPGSGESSILDKALDSVNLFANAQFYKYPVQSYSPVQHEIKNLAMLGWGWRQDGTNASDTLEFVPFNIDDTTLAPPAVNFLRYTSLLNGTDETYKELYYSFPGVRTLVNETITISFKARSQISGSFQLGIGVIQKFGTSGSPDVTTLLGSVTLSTQFQTLSVTGDVPDLSGKTLGTGESSLEIIIQYPKNTAQRIDIVNVFLKRGEEVTDFPYVDPYHDMGTVHGYNTQCITGEVKTTHSDGPFPGWIAADDGTIGNTGSNASNLADPITYDLFKLYWSRDESYCPVKFIYSTGTASQASDVVTGVGTTFTVEMEEAGTITFYPSGESATITEFIDATHLKVNTTATIPDGEFVIVYGSKGETATADFLAGKSIRLPLMVGRTLYGSSPEHPVCSSFGSSLLTAANFPAGLTYTDEGHTHAPSTGSTHYVQLQGTGLDNPYHDGVEYALTTTTGIGYANVTGPDGAANEPFEQPGASVNIFIKL